MRNNLVERTTFNNVQLWSKFNYKTPKKAKLVQKVKNVLKQKLSGTSLLETTRSKLPIIDLFLTYKLNYLFKDFLSGLTVGVIQIAPTMANSTTANLPPINGLYVAFFSVIAYLVLGTSKHLSLGTHGVISIMVGSTIEKFEGVLYPFDGSKNTTETNNENDENYISQNATEAKILIAMTLAIFVGLIQLILGFIRGGVISKYMSDSLIEALTIGSSFIIVVSQIDDLLGFKASKLKIPFHLIDNLIGIFKSISSTNWATVIISISSIVVIYTVKKFINDKYKSKLPAPIPIELIVVIIATVLASQFDFNENYGVIIVGPIPLGIPAPIFPPLKIFTMIVYESLSIALVSFALNISTAKFYAKKNNYSIDSNQELIAYGAGNFLSGLFSGMPATGGLTRTRIVETSGGKTQMFSLISSILVLIVIVGLGFLFEDLPKCVLGAIICTALIHNCFDVVKIVKLYKKSKYEALIWASTIMGVLILDIDYGLFIGLIVSILTVIIRSQLTPVTILGNIPNTDIYESIEICSHSKQINNMRIIRYEDSVYYANAESFVNRVFAKLNLNTTKLLKQLSGLNKSNKQSSSGKKIAPIQFQNCENLDDVDGGNKHKIEDDFFNQIGFGHLILDCSCVNNIDLMGVNAFLQLNEICNQLKISLHLAHLKYEIMEKINLLSESGKNKLDPKLSYPSIHDAVLIITHETNNDRNNKNMVPNYQVDNQMIIDETKIENEK